MSPRAIAAQFNDCSLGQVASGIRALGIDYVVEAAMGADMVADKEAQELAEKGFLTSSCCPAFVSYLEKQVPELAGNISHNLSPMAEIGRFIKMNGDTPVKTIFIGPCTAKKQEKAKPAVDMWIDCVITFEELQAMIDAKEINLPDMDETPVNDASYFGRVFGRSGGLTEAVLQVAKERGMDFEVKAEVCSGIEECKVALLKAKAGKLDKNFIEGMACPGGCVSGAGSLVHEVKSKMKVDQYGKKSPREGVADAIKEYKVGV